MTEKERIYENALQQIARYNFALWANKGITGQKDPKFTLRKIAQKALDEAEKREVIE